jgi:hypothetical protein
MNLQKEFVPYELALRMKDLGFEEPCFVTIDQTGFMHLKGTEYPIRGSMVYHDVNVPTWQSAFRWFREKYGLIPIYEYYGEWNYEIVRQDKNICELQDDLDIDYKFKGGSYEEAELACLEKLIEIVE